MSLFCKTMIFAKIKSFFRFALIILSMSMLGLSAQETNISNVSDPIVLQSPLVSQAYELLELGDSAGALDIFSKHSLSTQRISPLYLAKL